MNATHLCVAASALLLQDGLPQDAATQGGSFPTASAVVALPGARPLPPATEAPPSPALPGAGAVPPAAEAAPSPALPTPAPQTRRRAVTVGEGQPRHGMLTAPEDGMPILVPDVTGLTMPVLPPLIRDPMPVLRPAPPVPRRPEAPPTSPSAATVPPPPDSAAAEPDAPTAVPDSAAPDSAAPPPASP